MGENYWTRKRRYTRRGFIRGMGLAAGVVTLTPVLACGSNSSSNSGNKNANTTGAASTTSGAATKAAVSATSTSNEARRASGPGVTADAIALGTTGALSGPAAIYGQITQTMEAYLKRVNDEGGVNGRKINLHVEDDSYNPANTPPLTKKLVEQDKVLAIVAGIGTPTQSSVVDYLNDQKVPQLFVASGAAKWGDYKKYPWSTGGLQIDYPDEGRIYGKYMGQTWPGKKVGFLYQNDDFGKDNINGIKETLSKDTPLVDEETFETTASDVNTQINSLRGKGAETLFLVGIPKIMGLALKAIGDQGWKPNIILTSTAADPSLFPLAGGPQNLEGVISSGYFKQLDSGDPSIQQVKDLLAKYAPQLQLTTYCLSGYAYGTIVTETLKRAGVNPTRESLLAAAESFNKYQIPQMVDGVTVSTSKTNHASVRSAKLQKAQGGKFVYFGDVITGSTG